MIATKRRAKNDEAGNTKPKLRKYHESYLMFEFIQLVLDPDKAECIFCGMVISNDSMKPSNLKIHQNTSHQSTVENDDIFFVDRRKEYMETNQVTLHEVVSKQESILKQACHFS